MPRSDEAEGAGDHTEDVPASAGCAEIAEMMERMRRGVNGDGE